MYPMMFCLAAGVLGFDVGWEPRPQGGTEYIIQLDLPTVEAMKVGQSIESDFPAEVKNVRGVRLVVGRGQLPQKLPATAETPAADALLPPPTTPTIDPRVAGLSPIGPAAGARDDSRGSGTMRSTVSPKKGEPPAGAPSPDITPRVPRELPAGPPGAPLAAHKAVFAEQTSEAAQSQSPPAEQQSPREEPARPWLLLMLATLGLFASLGGNLYLGWITWDVYRRYRALVGRIGQGTSG